MAWVSTAEQQFAVLNSVYILICQIRIPVTWGVLIKVSHLFMLQCWGFDFQEKFFLPLRGPGKWYDFLLSMAVSGVFLPPCLWEDESSRDFSWCIVLSSGFLSHAVSKESTVFPRWMLNQSSGLKLGLLPSRSPLSQPVEYCLGYEFSIFEKVIFAISKTWLYMLLIFYRYRITMCLDL